MAIRIGLWKMRKRLLEKELQRVISVLKRMEIDKAILFGSFARGTGNRSSDIDLIIIKETTLPFLKRADDFYASIKPKVAMDILVYTKREYEKMLKENNSFIKHISKEGRTIYESSK